MIAYLSVLVLLALVWLLPLSRREHDDDRFLPR